MEHKPKTIISILVLVVFFLCLIIIKIQHTRSTPVDTVKKPTITQTSATVLTISKKDITEENFTGTEPVITGSSFLADTARAYITQTIADFRTQANTDVPAMRTQFGADAPTATYTIDSDATYTHAHKTESLVISQYVYTGGANGNSAYKVFTVKEGGVELLTLGGVIKESKKDAFTKYVIQKLLAYRPEDSTAPVVFEEEVKALKFDSFQNFSFDGNNLILYFDKYEVGPGVLGAFPFPLPLSKVKEYMRPEYL